MAFVGDTPPYEYSGVGPNEFEFPDVPTTAEIEAIGTIAASDEWAGELLAGVFDPPVTIEEAGTL